MMPMLIVALCYLEPPEQHWVSADTCSQSEITKLSARGHSLASCALTQGARADHGALWP